MTSFLDEPTPIRVAILGSTGSIGRQALDVVRAHPQRFEVVGLAAGSNAEMLMQQASEFHAGTVGLSKGSFPEAPVGAKLVSGPDCAEEIAAESGAEIVLNAVMGAAGLKATLATLAAGKVLALANKESLVAAGELVMSKAAPGQLRPVDSEHSALWQVLEGLGQDKVRKVVITGSGGPFLGRSAGELGKVTPAEALKHPVWDMGPKITIDSATLMNKGLEIIEAHFLFGFTYDEIEAVIHPEGLIHGMVETIDGAVFAHAAPPDMKLPIQVALAWPDRLSASSLKSIEWTKVHALSFRAPDTDVFRCLDIAREAGRRGGTHPAVLNAANEAAVAAFLAGRIDFLGIAEIVEKVLAEHDGWEPRLEGVLEADEWARRRTTELLGAS